MPLGLLSGHMASLPALHVGLEADTVDDATQRDQKHSRCLTKQDRDLKNGTEQRRSQ